MAELTPEEIKREQERLDLLQKQTAAAKELADTYKRIEKSGTKLSDTDKEILDLTKDLASFSSNIEKSIQKRLSGTATSKDLAKSIKELEFDKLQNERKFSDIARTIDANRAKALSEALRLHQQERSQIQSKLRLEGDTEDLYEQRKAAYQAGNASLVQNLTQQIKANEYNLKLKEKEIQKTIVAKDIQKDLVKQLNDTKKVHETIIKQQEQELELAKEAKKQKQQEEALDVLKEKFRVKEIKDMFTLAGLLKIILDAALKFNEVSVNIGKSLGYGADNANRVATNMKQMALGSSNLNVTLANAAEAMSQLNAATGGAAEYSEDALQTQIMLTKQFHLTGEEAAGLYKFSLLTGQASSVINDKMVGAFVSTRNSVRGSADFKTTMAEVAKISGQLAINFKNNPAELTKAVVQAQALGTTLEQAKDQGKQLLNFESSIEDELKAELLTGQAMNLERARAAALQGDQVTVMKELANQGMTLNKFQNMNVIAQESYAKAIGLTADQLSDQLRKQKIAQEQGKSLAQITKEEALEAEKRQAIQEKFNAAILKLQDFIGNLVAGPIGQLLEALMSVFDIVSTLISPVFKFIGGTIDYIVEGLKAIAPILGVIGGLLLVMNARLVVGAILSAIKGAWHALGGIPFVGPVLATAASLAAIGAISKYSQAGDMDSPADGKTQVSTKEGGLFELGQNDDFVAFPGASKMAKGGGGGKGGYIDISPLLEEFRAFRAEQKATTAAVNRVQAKDTSVVIDSKKVNNSAMNTSTKAP